MSRFYVSKDQVEGNSILITGKEAHHILNVMRLKRLDKVAAFDGTGKEYTGFISQIGSRTITVEIVETRVPPNLMAVRTTLMQAIPKKEKMGYIVEKATELGVNHIMPVMTARTIVDWDEKKKAAAVTRWQKIAVEASKQCGRVDIPEIEAVEDFGGMVKSAGDYDLALIAALDAAAAPLKDALRERTLLPPSVMQGRDRNDDAAARIAIAIGPEGDFTPEEIEKALEANFKLINLGPRVLKSDTAGLAVLAILNYEFRDR